MAKLRIAILTHSTNPRGGVVHALELGDALVRLGHDAVVHAPDVKDSGFFRESLCQTIGIPAGKTGDVAAMVAMRRDEYVRHFHQAKNRDFDVFHAQDSISGNALADLKTDGTISRFARTVHHVDAFSDPALTALQSRGIAAADRHFVVSRQWRDHLADAFGVQAEIVGNGVDMQRFTASADLNDAKLRAQLRLRAGPVVLTIGGIEERKNTLRILKAFYDFRRDHPAAQLVIAGGASLLDHSAFQHEFHTALAAMGLSEGAVIITGPLPQVMMPALYRCADLLLFASVKEGFGLAVLEAMASGTTVVASAIAPFTEYLGDRDVAWCDPYDVNSIGFAIRTALNAGSELRRNGFAVAAEHDWQRTAAAHVQTYISLREPANA